MTYDNSLHRRPVLMQAHSYSYCVYNWKKNSQITCLTGCQILVSPF